MARHKKYIQGQGHTTSSHTIRNSFTGTGQFSRSLCLHEFKMYLSSMLHRGEREGIE